MEIFEVFSPEAIKELGYKYYKGKVRTLNECGYMRNYLCDLSEKFCTQMFGDEDTVLEIGCGIGAVLYRLIAGGCKKVVAVDSEPGHLKTAAQLIVKRLPDSRDCLKTICSRLPMLTHLQGMSFKSILCAQSLHYMEPEDFEAAIKRIYALLDVGGTFYMTVGSPYIDVYKGFGAEYDLRVLKKDKYPGFMADVRKYHPRGANHNPGFFLFFDPEVLSDRIAEAGFEILEASFIDDGEFKSYQTALIAVKN